MTCLRISDSDGKKTLGVIARNRCRMKNSFQRLMVSTVTLSESERCVLGNRWKNGGSRTRKDDFSLPLTRVMVFQE